jgi:predicted esterase
MSSLSRVALCAALAPLLAPRPLVAEDARDMEASDPGAVVADIPSEDLRAGKDDRKRYFLIGPGKGAERPKAGFGLIVVLPGGPGGADFLPFVKRLYKHALPEGYVVAQLVSVSWTEGQSVIWPTAKSPVAKMRFPTEEFAGRVIDEVAARHKLDPRRIFTLTWSSSGPAAYAISLTNRKVAGSLIAMSVFKPESLPPLAAARGRAYYLLHSPDDAVCPYRMAEQASRDLEKAGAHVKLVTYEGGHGWKGNVFGDVRAGIEWLEKGGPDGKAAGAKR